MPYRLLLPAKTELRVRNIERVLKRFDCKRITLSPPPRWRVCDLAGEPEYNGASPLRVCLLDDGAVSFEEGCDRHFHRPRSIVQWIEVRVQSDEVTRPDRLHARLIALALSESLRLPVLETRNGIVAATPESFAAWCAREPDADVIKLGAQQHVTSAPVQRSIGVRRGMPAHAPAVASMRSAAAIAPLPAVSVCTRLWRRLFGLRTYIVALPVGTSRVIGEGLAKEIANTFHTRNVSYEYRHSRIIVVARANEGVAEAIGYFRRRAHPARIQTNPLQNAAFAMAGATLP